MQLIIYGFVALLLGIVAYYAMGANIRSKKRTPKPFPWFPLFGHLWQLIVCPREFFEKCRNLYGNYFRIQIYRTDFTIICDRKVALELTKAPESTFSIDDIFHENYFVYAFYGKPTSTAVEAFKKGILFNPTTIAQQIQEEAVNLVKILKTNNLEKPIPDKKLIKIFMNYAARTVAKCFLDSELKDDALEALEEFFKVLETAVICSNLIPFWLLNFFARKPLARLRRNITRGMEDMIRRHQVDHDLEQSSFVRAAVDKLDDDLTREKFTTEQIGDHVILLLFAGSVNTSNMIQHVMIDLANHTNVCDELRAELSKYIAEGDMEGIQKSPLLNACLMESSRLNANLIGFTRKCRDDNTLGGRDFKKGDTVAICTPMMMEDGEIFKEPLKYNPYRFIGEASESFTSNKVLNWGAGTHLCPGKQFAIYEIKMLIAYLVCSFRFEVPTGKIQKQHITFSSFAKRKADIKLIPI